MRSLRLIVRLTGFLIATLLCAVPVLFGALVRKPAPQAAYRWIKFWSRFWARWTAWTVGMKVIIKGTPPREPFILVSNHLGYMDIILMVIACPVYFLSKADVRNWPFLGPIIRHSNILFITRENIRDLNRVSGRMRGIVDQGMSVIFFPEGTSSNGAEVLPFKPSLLQVPVDLDMPVHYCSIHYETAPGEPAAGDAVCWWGDMTFLPHFLDLLRLKGFIATLTFAPDSIKNSDRKTLARDLQDAILQIFTPTDTH